jgi:hypothetical protein
MSWAKRNLYFLISGIVAIALLGAAGWFCYSSLQTNSANWDQLNQDYTQLSTLANKPIGAGNDSVNNIEAAREETKEAQERVAAARKYFTPVPGIPNTNRLDDRILAFAVRETVAQLRSSAAQHNVMLPLDFAFSFSIQESKAVYDPQSWNQLSRQLGEVKSLCETLFSCRVSAIDGVQRERTSDDINPSQTPSQVDYVDSVSVTNGNIVITPYQVTFRCFTPELGAILSSFANQSHTVVVKTLSIEPEEMASMTDAGMQPPGTQFMASARNGLPVVIDEKKLKVTMLLDFVKTLPGQGR